MDRIVCGLGEQNLQLLCFLPFVSLPHIHSRNIGQSASTLVASNFNPVSDQFGVFWKSAGWHCTVGSVTLPSVLCKLGVNNCLNTQLLSN